VSAGLPFEWALEDEFYHLQDLTHDKPNHHKTTQNPHNNHTKTNTKKKHYGEGRVVYTILGHGIATHADGRYQALVAQALEWAAGAR
jgi:type 1 glutamine amidotransferase